MPVMSIVEKGSGRRLLLFNSEPAPRSFQGSVSLSATLLQSSTVHLLWFYERFKHVSKAFSRRT
jgi:hypothetical protein